MIMACQADDPGRAGAIHRRRLRFCLLYLGSGRCEETGGGDPMPKRCLLLALGNDILKDDGVGRAAAGLLRSEFKEAVDIVEAPGTGLALLELLAG